MCSSNFNEIHPIKEQKITAEDDQRLSFFPPFHRRFYKEILAVNS